MREAADWYDKQRPGLGAELLDAFAEVFTAIRQQPELHPPVLFDVRRVNCTRFPYAVYFVSEATRVTIVAVVHHRRHPRFWQSRVTGD